MFNISRKVYVTNNIKTIVNNHGILELNEKHIEEKLDYKNFREIARKYNSDQTNYNYELVEEPKKHFNRIFVNEKLAIKVIMDCRTAETAKKFRARLVVEQYHVV